jgi:GDP-6-deoxy-D-talose 4-dehydrogenase
MPRTLITGIDGFTGRYLRDELLAAGHAVSGITHNPAATSVADNVHVCDLGDEAALKHIITAVRPDYVVHLAAIAFVAHSDIEAIYRTNLIGTRKLLSAIAGSGHALKAVVLASSANIYGNATVEPIDEAVPPAPANDYAVSKLAMEYMAKVWLDKLPITIARPFNYTGVGQSENFLLPKIVSHFRRRVPVIELGNLDVVRDFSDVRTVVRSYRQLLEQGQPGEVYNICSGIGYSLQDVLAVMREMSDHAIEVRVNPAFVRASDVKRLVGSRAKLNTIVPLGDQIPLADTLRWMLEAKA